MSRVSSGSSEGHQAARACFGMASGLRKLGYAHERGPLREALLDQAFDWTLLANTVLKRARGEGATS